MMGDFDDGTDGTDGLNVMKPGFSGNESLCLLVSVMGFV